MIDFQTGMGPTISGRKNLQMEMDEVKDNIPFPTISGTTAQSVNQQAPAPTTMAGFAARGGIGNTAKQTANGIYSEIEKKRLKKMYEEYLLAGERGADTLYNDAIQTYGEGIRDWIPPKQFYYDEKGIFLPDKYAQSVFVGTQKFKLEQAKQQKLLEEQARKRQEAQIVGQSIGAAKSPQEAAATAGMAGVNPQDYDKAFKTIPDPNAKEPYEIEKLKAETKRALAQAAKAYRDSQKSGTESAAVKIANLKQNNVGLYGTVQRYRQILSDLKANDAEFPEINEDIKQVQNQIRENDALIRTLQKEANLEPTEPPPPATSPEVSSAAESIRAGMKRLAPKRYSIGDNVGRETYVDKSGKPRDDLYDQAMAMQVVTFAKRNGFDLPVDKVAEELKNSTLEDILDYIIKQKGSAPAGPR